MGYVNRSDEFKTTLSEITGGADLCNYLESRGFFAAPASAKYHLAYSGGLCTHSMNVYDELVKLVEMRHLPYSYDTLAKVALCHDLYKADLYEEYMRNEKQDGKWISVAAYRTREPSDRYIVGDGGLTSYMIASQYLSLTDEEIVALCNYGHVINLRNYPECAPLLEKYPLALLLHEADMVATYLYEGAN